MPGLTELGRQWNDAAGSADQPWNTLGLSPGMTHEAEQPNPAIAEIARRLNLTGQNLYNTWVAPARRLGEAATSGTLDVTDPQTAGDAFGLAGGLAGARMPFAKAGELGAIGGKPITAFHGSPHDFDRFDLSRIGTGEGAQAYGHGLYFAENEKVAKDYKERLSGSVASGLAPHEEHAASVLNASGDREGSIAMLRSDEKTAARAGNKENAAFYGKAADLLESGWKPPISPPGKMYQVSIQADPEHFLDWDKPLSEHYPEIENKVLSLLSESERERYNNLKKYASGSMPSVGESTMNMLERSLGKENTSAALHQAGIPGIKYLDQGSRISTATKQTLDGVQQRIAEVEKLPESSDKAERLSRLKTNEVSLLQQIKAETRNYVVFDDKTIDILKKYGLLGLFGGGAASQVSPNAGQQ